MLALLPLALQAAPWIAKMLFGGAGEETISAIEATAKKVFGTTDENAIKTQMAADQSKADMFKAELEARRGELEAILADVQSARTQTVELAKAGSSIAWGAPVVSVLVVITFSLALGAFFAGKVPSSEVALLLIGTLAGAFTQVINYWLGSSAGSKAKDQQLSAMVQAARPSFADRITETVGALRTLKRTS